MTLRLPPEEYSIVCLLVLERDGYKCRHCSVRSGLHIHHIIFRSAQGPDEVWNLVTVCNQCHDAIHRGDLILVPTGTQVPPYDANYELYFLRQNGWRPE